MAPPGKPALHYSAMTSSSRKVLCVCTGNICRSPMLEVLLQHAVDERNLDFQVESAGVGTMDGHPASENAVACMAERGLDLIDHESRTASGLDYNSYALIICLSPEHEQHLIRQGADPARILVLRRGEGGVPDPIGGSLELYEECARTLEREVDEILEYLTGYAG